MSTEDEEAAVMVTASTASSCLLHRLYVQGDWKHIFGTDINLQLMK